MLNALLKEIIGKLYQVTIIKEINKFFKTIIKSEYEEVCDDLCLSQEELILFNLKYIEKLTNIEIAEHMGKTSSFVQKRLFFIRQKLLKLPRFTKKKFDCNTATESELRKHCIRLGKSKEYIDFCVDAFVNKLTRKEMAQKYLLGVNTVKQYKMQRRAELEL